MNKPITQSQLSFPNEKEIRITYENSSSVKRFHYVVNLVMITFFGLLFMKILPIIISIAILIIGFILKVKLLDNGLEEIILTPNRFQYTFAMKSSNRVQLIDGVWHIDFRVKAIEDVIHVSFLDVKLKLFHPNDLTLFVDKVAEMFEMEFHDTHRLSDKTETLTYKKKSIKQLKFPLLVSMQIGHEKIKIYDMLHQISSFEIDGNTQQLRYYEEVMDDTYFKEIPLNRIKRIQVLMTTRSGYKRNKNKIIVSFISVADERTVIFETQVRPLSQELTTMRDAEKIYTELGKIKALANVEIVKGVF